MIFKRVLATSDGTEAALRAVEVAAQLAVRFRCELLVITAVVLPQHVARAATMDHRAIDTYVERMAQEAIVPTVDVLRRVGAGAVIKAVVGPPAEVILSEVASSGADLVIMGRRSRYEAKDLILGSVSYRVARHVSVPILLVP